MIREISSTQATQGYKSYTLSLLIRAIDQELIYKRALPAVNVKTFGEAEEIAHAILNTCEAINEHIGLELHLTLYGDLLGGAVRLKKWTLE